MSSVKDKSAQHLHVIGGVCVLVERINLTSGSIDKLSGVTIIHLFAGSSDLFGHAS